MGQIIFPTGFPEYLLKRPAYVGGRVSEAYLDNDSASSSSSTSRGGASGTPTLLGILSSLFRQLLHLPLFFSLLPALLRVLCGLAHVLFLLILGDFDASHIAQTVCFDLHPKPK